MPHRPAVLIASRALAPVSPFVEGAYRVLRPWEGPPIERPDPAPDQVPEVRAL